MPSFYQGDLFRDLLATGEVDLEVIFARNLSVDRLQLGWEEDLSGFVHHFLDKKHPIGDAMRRAWGQRRRFHVVNGIWAEPAFAAALTALMSAGSAFAIYSEATNPNKQRTKRRQLTQQMFGKIVVGKAAGLLPVSHLASDFFKTLGAPVDKLYPFGYFRSAPVLAAGSDGFKKQDTIEVVFVGQLVHRKGVDFLIEAMQPLFSDYANLLLTIIGEGSERPQLEQQAAAISPRITFAGKLSSDTIPARLAVADIVILPSRWDGWGLVVNEALSVGVPVIISDQCGASDVIRSNVNGHVVPSEDMGALRGYLRRFLDSPKERETLRAGAKATGENISTEAVAPYLVQCLRRMLNGSPARPSAPWAGEERVQILSAAIKEGAVFG